MASPFRAKHLVPNAVTAMSVVFSFLAVNAAAGGDFTRACVLIFCAGLCDIADGKLARLLDAGTPFGRELDSLCDAISFGIVPAVVLHLAVLQQLGPMGAVVSVVYLLAGLFRLARFNLDHSGSVTFYGIPIPAGAAYMMSFVMLRDQVPPGLIALGVIGTAVAMISTLKVPNFKDATRRLPQVLLPMVLGLYCVFLARPTPWTFLGWNAFAGALVVANYRMLARHEAQDGAEHASEERRQAA